MIANIATVSRAKIVHNQNTALQCKWNRNLLTFKNVNHTFASEFLYANQALKSASIWPHSMSAKGRYLPKLKV